MIHWNLAPSKTGASLDLSIIATDVWTIHRIIFLFSSDIEKCCCDIMHKTYTIIPCIGWYCFSNCLRNCIAKYWNYIVKNFYIFINNYIVKNFFALYTWFFFSAKIPTDFSFFSWKLLKVILILEKVFCEEIILQELLLINRTDLLCIIHALYKTLPSIFLC